MPPRASNVSTTRCVAELYVLTTNLMYWMTSGLDSTTLCEFVGAGSHDRLPRIHFGSVVEPVAELVVGAGPVRVIPRAGPSPLQVRSGVHVVGQYVLGIRQRSERRGVVPGSGEVRVDDDGPEGVVLAVVLFDELHGDRSVEGHELVQRRVVASAEAVRARDHGRAPADQLLDPGLVAAHRVLPPDALQIRDV